jgi:hypothetical protein
VLTPSNHTPQPHPHARARPTEQQLVEAAYPDWYCEVRRRGRTAGNAQLRYDTHYYDESWPVCYKMEWIYSQTKASGPGSLEQCELALEMKKTDNVDQIYLLRVITNTVFVMYCISGPSLLIEPTDSNTDVK